MSRVAFAAPAAFVLAAAALATGCVSRPQSDTPAQSVTVVQSAAVAQPATAARSFTVSKVDIGGDGRTDYLTAEPGTGRVFVSRSTHVMVIDGPTGTVVTPLPAPALRPPQQFHGINYEPRDTPFEAQWKTFDERIVAQDFDTIHGLGLDTVRIFLPFVSLGGENPTDVQLMKVERVLDLAAERHLRVILMLFDGRSDHRPVRWPADESHLRALVARLMDHPALAMWDVKNEPDRDDGIYATKLEVRAWLAHMIETVRSLDPDNPITIGWSTATAATEPGMAEIVDVVSFHWYLPARDLPAAIAAVKSVAKGRPVMISEYGLPTWNSVFPGGHTEAEQAAYYANVLKTAKSSGVASTLVWTLHDLAAAPVEAKLPWQSGPQMNLGVLRFDGSPKPSAAVLRPGADLNGVPAIGPLNRLQKKFWQLALLAGFGTVFVISLVSRVARRRHDRRRRRRHDSSTVLE